ncbi:MAG: aminodeoxychorismate/anthranilate synthase component II [Acidiferrobacterales bacterium]|nr:aminodeoxychorismate/anthranilate synthase component II [Acidiferrobacterales bacterium]
MLLIIDNYDSFTYNLVQYLGELGHQSCVFRNDQIDMAAIERESPDAIVISPGPCTPNEAGVSVETVSEFAGAIPILGVCLGHQSICHAFGADIVRAEQVMHGKVSQVYHDNERLFKGVENPFTATRYHSLIAQSDSLPDCLKISAWTDDGVIMGVRHREHNVFGVQFHPESFLTACGRDILSNFLAESGIRSATSA